MIEEQIARIAWAKEALKSVIIAYDDRFPDDTPFEDYPDHIYGEDSRDDDEII